MPDTITSPIDSLSALHGAPLNLARRQDRAKRIIA